MIFRRRRESQRVGPLVLDNAFRLLPLQALYTIHTLSSWEQDMEPPRWPPTARQPTSTHRTRLPANNCVSDFSPTPFPSTLTGTSFPSQADGYATPDRQEDSSWDEAGDLATRDTATFQIELAECVETKTITTTTTTKRSYPPLLVRRPQSLESLDSKQYPLARKPTPQEISSFSYEIDGEVVNFREERRRQPSLVCLYSWLNNYRIPCS